MRVTVSNITLDGAALAAQGAGLSGTAFAALGFGAWGVEPSIAFDFEGQEPIRVRTFVLELLRQYGEQAAFVKMDDGRCFLWWASGTVEGVTADGTPLKVA